MRRNTETAFANQAIMKSGSEAKSNIEQLWQQAGAAKIFKNRKDFTSWLNTTNPGLDGAIPIQYIQSDPKKIADLLLKILHGVLA